MQNKESRFDCLFLCYNNLSNYTKSTDNMQYRWGITCSMYNILVMRI